MARTGKKNISPEVAAEIVRMYKRGDPIAAICARFGLCRYSVSTVARRHGIPPRPPGGFALHDTAERRRADIAALLGKGLIDREVAAEVGMSKGRVSKIRRQLGIPANGRHGHGRRGRERDAEIARLYGEGLSFREVAESVGMSDTGVRSALVRLGLPLRPRSVSRTGGPRTPRESLARRDAEAVRLYVEEGLSTAEVAKAIGITSRGTQNVLKRHGVVLGNPGRRNRSKECAERDEAIRYMREQGYTDKMIAAHLGTTTNSVNYARRRLGLVRTGRMGRPTNAMLKREPVDLDKEWRRRS